MLKNILDYMNKQPLKKNTTTSLSATLEAFVGNYYVLCEPEEIIYTVYYDGKIDNELESIDINDSIKIVAYVTSDYKYAFVLEKIFNKFIEDTIEYGFIYIPVKSFELNEFFIDLNNKNPEILENITFIDDDFLWDENIEFDFKAFESIDNGTKYLNPKHFSIIELINILKQQY